MNIEQGSITPAAGPAPWWTTSNTRCNTYFSEENAKFACFHIKIENMLLGKCQNKKSQQYLHYFLENVWFNTPSLHHPHNNLGQFIDSNSKASKSSWSWWEGWIAHCQFFLHEHNGESIRETRHIDYWAPGSHEAQPSSLSAVQKLPHFCLLECFDFHIKYLLDINYYPALHLYFDCRKNIFTLGITSFFSIFSASRAKNKGKRVRGTWSSLKIETLNANNPSKIDIETA